MKIDDEDEEEVDDLESLDGDALMRASSVSLGMDICTMEKYSVWCFEEKWTAVNVCSDEAKLAEEDCHFFPYLMLFDSVNIPQTKECVDHGSMVGRTHRLNILNGQGCLNRRN